MTVNPSPPIGALAPIDLRALPPEAFAQVNPFARGDEGEEPSERMRVGELSRRSGVAVGNIKFYVREGLLPAGESTAKTQALYGPAHLRRLRTIRVLIEVGGLSLAQVRAVLEAIEHEEDAEELSRVVSYAILGAQQGAAGSRKARGEEADTALAATQERTDAFVAALGLEVEPGSPARTQLAESLMALETLGPQVDPVVFAEHARLAYELAQFEIAAIDLGVEAGGETDRARAAEQVAVGSMAFGAAFMALRAMAHEHETRRRFRGEAPQPQATDCAPFGQPPESP